MAPRPLFDDIWTPLDDFEPPAQRINFCRYAQEFAGWAAVLVSSVSQEPSIVTVNQAKILLQDKWHDWRSIAPRRHRNHLGNRGHTCLFQVYEQAYHHLRVLELSLTPPLLFIPAPPPPTPQIPEIFLGEEEE
jgi:hypothetical protein